MSIWRVSDEHHGVFQYFNLLTLPCHEWILMGETVMTIEKLETSRRNLALPKDGATVGCHAERSVETVVHTEGAAEAEGATEQAVESAVEGLVRKRRLDESPPVVSTP